MQNTKTKAIISLVCGIVSIVLPWFGWGCLLSLAAGIVAVILAVQTRKFNDENKGMATAGLITGIIGIVLSGIMLVCVVCAVCIVASSEAALTSAINSLY